MKYLYLKTYNEHANLKIELSQSKWEYEVLLRRHNTFMAEFDELEKELTKYKKMFHADGESSMGEN